MIGTLVQPVWLAVLLGWDFAVLSSAQLTIRLIMAFSVRTTLVGAALLTIVALAAAVVYDVAVGSQAAVSTRLELVLLPMVLMGLAGFLVARRVLRIKRLRGQVIAGLMVGLLDPHLFTLLAT
jgi:hypothetical protein